MKKTGFTLAEILITMSIIGVVAALTAPALIHDASNARTGPILEKTRAAIELANQNILFRNRATDLLVITGNQPDAAEVTYLQLLAQNFQNSTFIPAAVAGDQNPIGAFQYTDRRGNPHSGANDWNGESDNNINDSTPKLILSDNVTISVNADNPPYLNFNRQLDDDGNIANDEDGNPLNNGQLGRRGSYSGPLANLLVDLNGTQVGPNIYGRDIFFFTVDRSGVVIPDGSELFNDYMTWNNNNNFDNRDYTCIRDNVITGRGCAGAILDNNRRVDYR